MIKITYGDAGKFPTEIQVYSFPSLTYSGNEFVRSHVWGFDIVVTLVGNFEDQDENLAQSTDIYAIRYDHGDGRSTTIANMNRTFGEVSRFKDEFDAVEPREGIWLVASNQNEDDLYGTRFSDKVSGRGGDDSIFGRGGNDRLDGGEGADWLMGGAGRDRLTGGDGADVFAFSARSHSKPRNPDVITDFTQGDDLIDIVSLNHGDDYRWMGMKNFTGKSDQIRYEFSKNNHGDIVTSVEVAHEGSKKPFFAVELVGKINLTMEDFLL